MRNALRSYEGAERVDQPDVMAVSKLQREITSKNTQMIRQGEQIASLQRRNRELEQENKTLREDFGKVHEGFHQAIDAVQNFKPIETKEEAIADIREIWDDWGSSFGGVQKTVVSDMECALSALELECRPKKPTPKQMIENVAQGKWAITQLKLEDFIEVYNHIIKLENENRQRPS